MRPGASDRTSHACSSVQFLCGTHARRSVHPSEYLHGDEHKCECGAGLLLASVRDPDPVVFFEAKMLYRTVVEDVPVGDYVIPLGQARIARAGSDITLVGWGQQVAVLERAVRPGLAHPPSAQKTGCAFQSTCHYLHPHHLPQAVWPPACCLHV